MALKKIDLSASEVHELNAGDTLLTSLVQVLVNDKIDFFGCNLQHWVSDEL